MIDHFRKKSLFFRDTRDHQEHDAKNRLSIPTTSSEKPLAEIISVKKKLTLELEITFLFQVPRKIQK